MAESWQRHALDDHRARSSVHDAGEEIEDAALRRNVVVLAEAAEVVDVADAMASGQSRIPQPTTPVQAISKGPVGVSAGQQDRSGHSDDHRQSQREPGQPSPSPVPETPESADAWAAVIS